MINLRSKATIPQRVLPTGMLILLFSVLLVSGGWVGAYLLMQFDYSKELVRINNENAFVAAAFEEHARRVIKTADTALVFLKREFEEQGAVTDSMRNFGAITKNDLSAIQVALADPDGNLIYSAVKLKTPLNISQREHFQYHKNSSDPGMHISKPVMAVATGTWTFFLSRRINRPDGSFGGIVSVGIDPFYFGKVYNNVILNDRRSGLIVGTDHIVRVRISRSTNKVGDDIGGYSPVFREAAQSPVGGYEVFTALDNNHRVASYRVMPDFPLIVIVSSVKVEALANFEARKAAIYLGASLFTLFVAFFCFLLIRADRIVGMKNSRLKNELAERKKAEEELVESRNLFTGFMDHMPAIVWLFDDDGTLIYQNKVSRELIGEDATGKKALAFPSHCSRSIQEIVRDNDEAREKGFSRSETELEDKSGIPRTLEFNRFLFTRAGKKPHLGAIALDVTERRNVEKERQTIEKRMQEAQNLESLGLLAGGIAHDFNNLLFGITGNIDIALSQLEAGSPLVPALKRAESSAQVASDLTNQMLAYSGKGSFVIEPIDLSALVHEMAGLLGSFPSKLIEVRYELEPDLPPVEGDATQLRQVVMNLITNAVESHCGKEGVVRVSTGLVENLPGAEELAGPFIRFTVSDMGCGMDDETLAKIFEPFFTTKPTGRGLGLSAVHGIVRAHKGYIKIDSRPGLGSEFCVCLPICGRTVAAVAAEENVWPGPVRARAGAGGFILLVDDEEYVRTTTETFLKMSGYGVITAADGVMAVELFEKNSDQIVAVVLDMTMPRMGGMEAFARMHELNGSVPVIMTSGYSREDAINRLRDGKIAGFLQKPYRMRTLIELLEKVASGRAPQEC